MPLPLSARRACLLLPLLLGVCLFPVSPGQAAPPAPANQQAPSPPPLPPGGYDPAADPAADLAALLPRARSEGKHVLLKVGGNWCVWCRLMEKFFQENPEVEALLEEHYLMLKVNVSKENKNPEFLARFPRVPAYPHLFVLDAEGSLLESQEGGPLEEGRGYSVERMRDFLVRWAPPGAKGENP